MRQPVHPGVKAEQKIHRHKYLLRDQEHVDGAEIKLVVEGHSGVSLICRVHAGIKLPTVSATINDCAGNHYAP